MNVRRKVSKKVREDFGQKLIVIDEIVSRKPYTMVKVWDLGKTELVGYGFSKVRYPDTFSYLTGVDIATEHALDDLVEEIISSGGASLFLEEEQEVANVS